MVEISQKAWWGYLEKDLQDLLSQSLLLFKVAARIEEKFDDYSFVVFPAAKAYEGFLKKLFLERKFITPADYYGKHFRIGKALNPELEPRFRRESVYDRIVAFCGGRQLADQLWETWKRSRNLVFHWFPEERKALTLPEAEERVNRILTAIDLAYKACKV